MEVYWCERKRKCVLFSAIERSTGVNSSAARRFDRSWLILYVWEPYIAPAVSSVNSSQVVGRSVQSYQYENRKHGEAEPPQVWMYMGDIVTCPWKEKKERNANYTFVQHIAALMSLLTTKRWVQSVEKANRKIRQTVPQVWTGPRHRFNQVDCRVVRRTFCWCVNRISRDVTPRVFFLSPVVHRFIVVPALFESSPSVLFLLYDHFFSFYKHIINISIYTQTQTEDKTSDLKKKKMNFVDKE